VEQAEREMMRSQRYGNPLSLAVITIKPIWDNDGNPDENQLDACISYVAEILCANIRKTDIIGRCNSDSFSILFTETRPEEAVTALENLLELCEPDGYINYEIYSACTRVFKGRIEELISETLGKTVLRERKTASRWNDQSDYMRAMLGKYNLSDILGFNKKGKNHF
jgi:GGDEF domain-containing protein